MKISENKYRCEWCGEDIDYIKEKSTGGPNPLNGNLPGKNTIVNTLKCPKCNRNVSQRRSGGLK